MMKESEGRGEMRGKDRKKGETMTRRSRKVEGGGVIDEEEGGKVQEEERGSDKEREGQSDSERTTKKEKWTRRKR